MRRFGSLVLALCVGLGAVAAVGVGATPASAEEKKPEITKEWVLEEITKYRDALKEAKLTDEVSAAEMALKMAGSNWKAGFGMYSAYKGKWDKVLGWEATKAQLAFKNLKAGFESARATKVVDGETYKDADDAYAYTINGLLRIQANDCAAPEADKICPQLEGLPDTLIKERVKLWETAIADPRVSFEHIYDDLLTAHRLKAYAGYMGKMDDWMTTLGGQKEAYWKGQFKAAGGQKAWTKENASSSCVMTGKKPGKSLKTSSVKYVFGKKDTVYVHCVFKNPPKSWRRDSKDFWEVRLSTGSHVIPTGIKKIISRPSTKTVVDFSFSAKPVVKAIEKEGSKEGFLGAGSWVRVQAVYVVRAKTEKVWETNAHGKTSLVQKWSTDTKSRPSMLLKFR